MADISNVDTGTIKDLYERLESLSCMSVKGSCIFFHVLTLVSSPNYDSDPLLGDPEDRLVSDRLRNIISLSHVQKTLGVLMA